MTIKDEQGFHIFDSPCNECLFGPNKIVSEKRKREILADCKRNDSHFVCHKSTMNGDDIACKSFFERYSTNLERIAGRLGFLFYVDLKRYLDGEVRTYKPEKLSGTFSTEGRIK